MADNVTLDSMSGGDTCAADDIGGIKHQRVKVTLGADGTNDGDLSSSNPMPVSAASLPLPSGAATGAKQDTGNTSLASIDGKVTAVNTGAVVVASSALPSGAATAAKQPALGTAGTPSADVLTVQGVTSMTALKVDGSAVTQPVSAASLPLPSGASTAAKQPALGTAGTPSSDVITVQGASGMTAMKVDGSAVTQPVSAASLPLPSGASTAANQSTANTSLASIDGKITAVNTGAVVVSSSALPSGASTSAKQDTQITAEQAIQTSVELIDDAIKADDAAFTPATTKVMMAGFEFDDSSPDTVDEGDAGAARMSSRREVYVQVRDAAGNERGLNVDSNGAVAVTVASVPSHAVTNAGTFAVQDSAAEASLSVIDDWDESDRAKVNPIVGQAGVAAGAGAVGATVQRTTLASDDPAVASLGVMDDWDESDRAKVNPIVGQAGVAAGAGAVGATVQRVTLASDDPAVATLGATSGAKVITDANGTLQQYLRGLIYLAITTANYPSRAFLGTAQTVINTSTDIAAGNFSGSPAAEFDNTTDAAVPYSTNFLATAVFPDWAAAPVAGTTVSLYLVLKNVDGTSDDTDAPSGTANGGGLYVGSWVIAAADALQRRTIGFTLPPGVAAFDAYIKNETAQNMNNDAGTNASVKITPVGYGPVV